MREWESQRRSTLNARIEQGKRLLPDFCHMPDGILAEMIKTAEHEITLYLTKYFNVLFARAKFSLEWSKAIIIPQHKKGDVNDPGNYRGISLLSILLTAD